MDQYLLQDFQNIFRYQKFENQLQIQVKMNNQKENQQVLAYEISGLAMTLGICKASFDSNSNQVISHMPISLYPYILKLQTYQKVKKAQYIWQKLFTKLSTDRQFITNLAEKFCKNDEFMTQIFNIYKKDYIKDKIGVACTRIDYMGDDHPQLVQFNLMSIGLNGISDRVQDLHKITNQIKKPIGKYSFFDSRNQQTMCKAFLFALEQDNLKQGLILMVVHQKQFNYGDHNIFRIQMLKQGRKVETITYNDLIQKIRFDQNQNIPYLNDKQINAFYFRTGYAVQHFPTKKHWDIREKIQKSRSIKFPSIEMIIINSKRMQSQLSKEKVLRRYLSQGQVNCLLGVTGQIYDFDDLSTEQIEQLIKKTQGQNYVLKPNRQGGGNNFFCQQATQRLKQLVNQKQHLNNYILMKKINCQSRPNYFIIDHKPKYVQKSNAEYSTLGSFVYRGDEILLNQMGGTLVRLKDERSNQGGVAVGLGVIAGMAVENF